MSTLFRGRATVWLLIALAAATRIAVALADHRSLIANDIFPDDAFYYLRIAANVTAGRGLTFDGAAPTNGFHPLYLLVLLPIMAVARTNLVLPIHLSAILLGIWASGTAAALYAFLNKLTGHRLALFALFLWAVCPYFVLMSVNGLETGLAITFVLLVPWLYLAWFCEDRPPGPARALVFGCVCGLGLLARVDLALLIAAVGVDRLLRHARQLGRGIGSVAIALGATAMVWLPWGLVSHAATGHWLPLSGAASRQIALNLGWQNLQPIWANVSQGALFDPEHVPATFSLDVATKLAFVFLFENPLLAPLRVNAPGYTWSALDDYFLYRWFRTSPALGTALLLTAIAVVAVVARRRTRGLPVVGDDSGRRRAILRRVLGVYLALFCLGYTFYSPTHWYFNRYLVGPILLVTAWALIEVGTIISRRPRLAFAAGTVAVVIGVCQLGQWKFVQNLHWSATRPAGFLATWNALGPRVGPQERVAAFQAGTYGYFSGRDIINLDGKANQDAFVALKHQRLHDYVAAQRVRYILDWEGMLKALYLRHAPPDALPIRSVAVDPNGSGVQLFQVGE